MADESTDAVETWKGWLTEKFDELLVYALKEPYSFIYYVLLCLSPLFLISAVLSWKLAKIIEKEQKEQKQKAKRENAIKKKRKAD